MTTNALRAAAVKIARIFVLLFVSINLYWPTEKNDTGLVSGQLKKTDASILGRCEPT